VTDADAGAFLIRLVRLDRTAVVRLRPAGDATEVWAMLPFDVLATRRLRWRVPSDVTVSGADLLGALETGGAPADPARLGRRDTEWRWALPPGRGNEIERIPAVELIRVAAAASHTIRQAVTEGVNGRAVGERMLRDALLDHVAITVDGSGGERVDIPVRVVQGVVRMGFLGQVASGSKATVGEAFVTVRLATGWTGVDASYGSVWYRPSYPLRFR
jgi:hypothetical protein